MRAKTSLTAIFIAMLAIASTTQAATPTALTHLANTQPALAPPALAQPALAQTIAAAQPGVDSKLSGGECRPASECCKVCRKGKACGDSCISRKYNCSKGTGCACNASEICR